MNNLGPPHKPFNQTLQRFNKAIEELNAIKLEIPFEGEVEMIEEHVKGLQEVLRFLRRMYGIAREM